MVVENILQRVRPIFENTIVNPTLFGMHFLSSLKGRIATSRLPYSESGYENAEDSNEQCSSFHRRWLSTGFPGPKSEIHFSISKKTYQVGPVEENKTESFYVQSAKMEQQCFAYLIITNTDQTRGSTVRYIQINQTSDGIYSSLEKQNIRMLQGKDLMECLKFLHIIHTDKKIAFDSPLVDETHNTPRDLNSFTEMIETMLYASANPV